MQHSIAWYNERILETPKGQIRTPGFRLLGLQYGHSSDNHNESPNLRELGLPKSSQYGRARHGSKGILPEGIW